ncbi:hypothetical protein [Sulfurihydrogenibium sp.]|jgi:hypothetical protein|uniref:hypothetical protein n=1 Tax=Sulfurihydrogenibium sp. TaxID=2053621 RepID=UPI0026177CA7|nr:hypothetical protein [Sulfurihydrogenibium sp.]
MAEAVPKIHIVILSKAKNLLFFFSSQKSKEEILRTYVLRMTRKGKLTGILEHSPTSFVILSVSEESPTFIEFFTDI